MEPHMQRKTLLLVLLGPLAQDFQDFPDSADVFHGWYFDTQFCKKDGWVIGGGPPQQNWTRPPNKRAPLGLKKVLEGTHSARHHPVTVGVS